MESNAIPLDKLGIPPELARYVEPASPREVKILAARGLLPAPPKILIALQYCLVVDADPAVSQAAAEGLRSMPTKMLEGALDERTHPKILEYFAFNRSDDEVLVEALLLKRQLNDRSICYLAEVVGPKMLDIIAANQERLLMAPAIFEHMRKNPTASKAVLDRTESFLRMYHAISESPAPAAPVAEPAEEVIDPVAAGLAAPSEPLEGNLSFRFGFEEEQDTFNAALTSDGESKEGEKGDLWATVSKMPIGAKIKLAFFGNQAVRSILVRDSNKMVARAVMKSPRLTDSEVIAIAKNRNVADDVLREIGRNKEWMKLYAVKLALVNNPKCPVAISVPLVGHMMAHDLKMLASNKNVSSVISTSAKQMMRKKAPS